ncbi:MAG: hypothetical protein HC851_01885 [Acaryochloris sp. RU_4_1]|nr:hypothetical protein [Acaryochloris sp. RU_4_1]NJN38614.1 hypothetical protein [Acaryochloridaceae cyanobacterium CSU_3_4]NJR53385.1 hypothetical protein [Acaryochloris sp. CRU_2_0]
MTTHFIAAEIELDASPADLQANIEAKLRIHGEPLRWAVTAVNTDQAQVEAVVLAPCTTDRPT